MHGNQDIHSHLGKTRWTLRAWIQIPSTVFFSWLHILFGGGERVWLFPTVIQYVSFVWIQCSYCSQLPQVNLITAKFNYFYQGYFIGYRCSLGSPCAACHCVPLCVFNWALLLPPECSVPSCNNATCNNSVRNQYWGHYCSSPQTEHLLLLLSFCAHTDI